MIEPDRDHFLDATRRLAAKDSNGLADPEDIAIELGIGLYEVTRLWSPLWHSLASLWGLWPYLMPLNGQPSMLTGIIGEWIRTIGSPSRKQ